MPFPNTILHVGKSIVQTVAIPGGGPLPPGQLTAVSTGVAVTPVVDPVTNSVTLHGVSVGACVINYTAAGYAPAADNVTVLAAPPLPVLGIVDGPEV